jgi:hypothetical protein
MPAKTPELPDLPDLEAGPQTHLDFANHALKRRHNLIARIRKYGHVAPMIVLIFENGDELALTHAQHGYGAGLRDQLASYDGQLCPGYTRPQLLVIYAALIRASDLWVVDDQHEALLLDLNTFVVRCLLSNDHVPLVRPTAGEPTDAEFYRAVADFQVINQQRNGHPSEAMPVPLFWHYPKDYNGREEIEMWLPRSATQTYLRAVKNWMAGAQLRNSLMWFGWQQRELHPRSKADWRRRAHARVWVLPVPWPLCDVDLLEAANGTAVLENRGPTVPDGPLSNTRAREGTPRARVRKGGTVRDRGTAQHPGENGTP